MKPYHNSYCCHSDELQTLQSPEGVTHQLWNQSKVQQPKCYNFCLTLTDMNNNQHFTVNLPTTFSCEALCG